jgi:hypothetical protein
MTGFVQVIELLALTFEGAPCSCVRTDRSIDARWACTLEPFTRMADDHLFSELGVRS